MTDNPHISEEDKALFRRSIGKIERIQHDRIHSRRPAASRTSLRRPYAEQTGSSSGREQATITPFTTADLEAGDELSFIRPGLQQKIFRKLRRGQFRIEATVDLHGKNIMQAKTSLSAFLQACREREQRCVLIIHGKGHGSDNRKPVIKNKLNSWLREYQGVLAFCSARPGDGGTGAAYVLLRNSDQ